MANKVYKGKKSRPVLSSRSFVRTGKGKRNRFSRKRTFQPLKQKRILVVDSDPQWARTAKAALVRLGYQVDVTTSGRRALMIDGGTHELILMDWIKVAEDKDPVTE